MSKIKPQQKIVSFTQNKADFDKIREDMKDGWAIISIMQNGSYFVSMMEKIPDNSHIPLEDQVVYIPPKKKIKISYN